MIKIVAISDTHNKHNQIKIPNCDLLICAGDATGRGRESEVRNFAKWFEKQPAKFKIFVPGNHEVELENNLPYSREWFEEECPSGIMLINQTVNILGIRIFGSPVTPWFHSWAWNKYPSELETFWKETIPEGINILITHGPAATILDQVLYVDGTPKTEFLGCYHLLKRIREVKPDLHFCGHIHSGHGEKHINGTSFYNASICDEQYQATNPVTIVEYNK